ncbi:nucleoside hydrolase [Roseibium marinum]|uniref:Inosine-uridine nucleoside N-ribohydrolase n=1 Tax=Roseibium marinum TaxID=281252 RepID=A0A2S3UL31_9HYPH|nr:nucleoside hydrolase [Roseibium marinum]POF28263.1 inosine-uridine nucleoside N-ribohydrolase [Roseibium marinum]
MIWIDTDMGFDDILAVMIIADSRKISGISLVFGNAPLEEVRKNAAGARSLLGWRMPIHTGAAKAILGELITPGHVLGPTGIPTRGARLPECPPVPVSPALAALSGWLEALEEPGEILALGPLTNLAVLALSRPDLLPKIAKVTWMGGAAGRGNQTPSAEFNAYADPEALKIVLDSGVSLDFVDLELCRQVLIGPDDLRALEATGTQKGRVLADLCGAYVDIALERGREKMAVYDPCAAAALVIPEAFTFAPGFVEVELTGTHTRGRTVLDQRPGITPNCRWAMHADAPRVLSLALETLQKAALS